MEKTETELPGEECPVCGKGTLVRETRKVPYTYGGDTIEVEQPGRWCTVCNEGILNVDDLAVTAEARRVNIINNDADSSPVTGSFANADDLINHLKKLSEKM